MTTVTIWIPKSDLEKFYNVSLALDSIDRFNREAIKKVLDYGKLTIYTEKRHIELLQVNVSLDLFVKLNLK